MKMDLMRQEIVRPYESELWRHKISTMPDEQILAIYKRFVRDGLLPAKTMRRITNIPAKPAYYCKICGARYERDNPELRECEVCGIQWR